MHGKTDAVEHDGHGVFAALPERFSVIRYHSLAIEHASLPRCARGRRDGERRRDHGRAPPRARGDEDAARGRAVPSRIDPHRARARDAEEFPGGDPMRTVDLRSDTVTRPTRGDARGDGRGRGRRRRLRRRPDRQRAAGADRGDARQGGGAVRSQRHAEQPRRHHEPLRPRRRIHRRPDGAHLPLGRRRRGGARQRAAAAARARGRRLAARCRRSRRRSSPTMRISRAAACCASRTRSAARCCRSPTSPRRCALAKRRGLATHLDGARLFNAAVALGGEPRATARDRGAVRQRLGLLLEGARRAGRLGAGRLARVHRAARPLAQDGRRRHAPGRRPRGGGAARARPPRRPARRRPCAGEPLRRRARRHARPTVETPQTNIVFADLDERARRRA